MRKVSFFCLLSVLSLLLVVSPSFAATHFPLYPPPPILDLPAADIQSGVSFGYSLAAGDLNGDGYADIVVGVPFYEEAGSPPITNQGRVYVYDGSGGCLMATLTYPGAARAVKFGWSVAIGDFDGDGSKDIIVGAPYDDGSGTSGEGKVYVFWGSTNFTTYLAIDKPVPGQDDAHFGYAVAAGSTDGDAADELIVGAPDEDVGGFANRGKGYHFKYSGGGAVSTDLSPAVNQADMWYGFSVAMGDLMAHGGGQKDPIFGAPGYNNGILNEAGRVYWWNMSGVPSTTAIDHPFPEGVAHFGWAVVAGDVVEAGGPPDGNVELIVGTPHADIVSGKTNIGIVYVLDKTGSVKYAFVSPNWAVDRGEFGSSLALGDIDGDGFLDIIVGAPGEQVGAVNDSGRIYAFHSDSAYTADGSLLNPSIATVVSHSGLGSITEYLADGVGNNDGVCQALENCANVTEYHNHEANAAFGWAVASGNINNAPFDDIVASGIMLDVGLVQNVGRTYLFFEDAQPNAPTGLTPTGTVTSKTVTLATDGIFVDKDVATCGPGNIWTDSHQRTQWRIDNTGTLDCITNGPGVVYDNQTVPPPPSNLYQTPPIDLTTRSAGPQHAGNFNFGDTIYWCVRYKDNVDGGNWTWSDWTAASFVIGTPNLEVTNAADINQATSPYAPVTWGAGGAYAPGPPPTDPVGSVDYKTVSCVDSRDVDITITNNGTATATVTSIALLAGTDFTFVAPSPPTTPFNVVPGGTIVVRVKFTATTGPAGSPYSDTLRIIYNDPVTADLALNGASAAPTGDVVPGSPPPYPGTPPYDHDFGNVTIGDPATCFDVDVKEIGGVVPLKVTGITLNELFVSPLSPLYTWQWKDAADQAYWTANGFLYVPAGGTKKITVCFDPKAGSGCGLREANLEVTHNGDGACLGVTERTTFAATVVGPDLEGRWTTFLSSYGSTLVRGTLRIANIGTKDLIDTIVDLGKKYFRVWFYLSTDATLDTGDTPLYSQDVFYLLRAGQVKTIGFNWTFGSSQKGNYIIAVIDSENNFVECIDFLGPIPPLPGDPGPPPSPNPTLPAYFPFWPGNTNINNIAVPAKLVLGAFPIP